jgi:hypothetical protein
MGVMMDIIEYLPLPEAAVAREGYVAGPDSAQGEMQRPQLFA